MKIRQILLSLVSGAFLMCASCAQPKQPELELQFSPSFNDRTVEIVTYLDSIPLAKGVIENGRATFKDFANTDSVFLGQIMVEGRVRGYFVAEPGHIKFNDSISVAKGTPLNDRMARYVAGMDSVDNLDDEVLLTQYLEDAFKENRDNVIGGYFAIEWTRFARRAKIDSMMTILPTSVVLSPKMQKFIHAAQLREDTGVGSHYVDFSAEQPGGADKALSSFIKPGKYTLVDFWASWCPYCIKELPQLSDIYARYKDKGLEIVGVAVRDTPSDTKRAVEKHNIPWPIMYGAARIPYDIYGFNGIPHHILIDPDGIIISRGENAAKINERLQTIFKDEAK